MKHTSLNPTPPRLFAPPTEPQARQVFEGEPRRRWMWWTEQPGLYHFDSGLDHPSPPSLCTRLPPLFDTHTQNTHSWPHTHTHIHTQLAYTLANKSGKGIASSAVAIILDDHVHYSSSGTKPTGPAGTHANGVVTWTTAGSVAAGKSKTYTVDTAVGGCLRCCVCVSSWPRCSICCVGWYLDSSARTRTTTAGRQCRSAAHLRRRRRGGAVGRDAVRRRGAFLRPACQGEKGRGGPVFVP